jgi:hypothetical protein
VTRSHHPDPFTRDLANRVFASIRTEVSEGDPADCEPESRYWYRVTVRHGDLLMMLIEQEVEAFLPKVRAAFASGVTEVNVDTDAGRDRVVARCSVGVRIDWIDAELKTEGRRS